MTDYETKYRDLVAGLEALADDWELWDKGLATAPGMERAARILRALLASSPAEREGEGEPDGCRLNGCHPAPVSSGEACPSMNVQQHPLSAPLACELPLPHGVHRSGIWQWRDPAPVLTPITEGGEQQGHRGWRLPYHLTEGGQG